MTHTAHTASTTHTVSMASTAHTWIPSSRWWSSTRRIGPWCSSRCIGPWCSSGCIGPWCGCISPGMGCPTWSRPRMSCLPVTCCWVCSSMEIMMSANTFGTAKSFISKACLFSPLRILWTFRLILIDTLLFGDTFSIVLDKTRVTSTSPTPTIVRVARSGHPWSRCCRPSHINRSLFLVINLEGSIFMLSTPAD